MATPEAYANLKGCPSCNRALPLSEFNRDSNRKDGKSPYCRSCNAKRCREWASRPANRPGINENWKRSYNKARGLVAFIKERGSCAICGESESVCLDFHHVDPSEKQRQLSGCNSVKGIIDEATKCVLLCRNCHAKGHAGLIDMTTLNAMSSDHVEGIVSEYARIFLLRED